MRTAAAARGARCGCSPRPGPGQRRGCSRPGWRVGGAYIREAGQSEPRISCSSGACRVRPPRRSLPPLAPAPPGCRNESLAASYGCWRAAGHAGRTGTGVWQRHAAGSSAGLKGCSGAEPNYRMAAGGRGAGRKGPLEAGPAEVAPRAQRQTPSTRVHRCAVEVLYLSSPAPPPRPLLPLARCAFPLHQPSAARRSRGSRLRARPAGRSAARVGGLAGWRLAARRGHEHDQVLWAAPPSSAARAPAAAAAGAKQGACCCWRACKCCPGPSVPFGSRFLPRTPPLGSVQMCRSRQAAAGAS